MSFTKKEATMHPLHNEALIYLGDVPSILPTARGKTISFSTVRAWVDHGAWGVKLEVVCIGGRTYTSHQALGRFHERVTAARKEAKRRGRVPKILEAARASCAAELANT